MKAIILLIVVGLFTSCKSDTPTCKQQINLIGTCMRSEFNTLSCKQMNELQRPATLGANCANKQKDPDFKTNCLPQFKTEFQNLKKGLNNLKIKKCPGYIPD